MTMTFSEVVNLGLEKEKATEDFYQHWANRIEATDGLWPRARVLLLSLAREEGEHQKIFEKFKAIELQPDGSAKELNLQVEDYAPPTDMASSACTKEVIEAAIASEETAIRFYSDLAKVGGSMRGTCEQLAKQEKSHKRRLEDFMKEHPLELD